MDFKKIDKFSYKYLPYDKLSNDEKKKFTDRKIEKKAKINIDNKEVELNMTIVEYASFPYYAEIEKLANTQYSHIMPFGKITTDFLLNENKKDKPCSLFEILKAHFSSDQKFGLNQHQIQDLVKFFTIEKNKTGNFIAKEENLFTFFVINEFMQQTTIDTYGDFIEQKGNEIYDNQYKNFDVNFNEYTKSVFNLLYHSMTFRFFNVLTLSRERTKSDIEKFKNITKEKMLRIIQMRENSDLVLIAPFSSRHEMFDNVLYQIREDVEEPVNIKEFEKDLIELFTHFTYHSSTRFTPNVFGALLNDVLKFKTLVQPEKTYLNSKNFFVNDIDKVFKRINEVKEETKVDDFFSLIHIFMSPKSVIKNGNSFELIELLFDGMNKENDEFVNFVKLLSETVLLYDETIPTLRQWKNIFNNDNDELSFPPKMLFPLVLDNYSNSKRKIPSNIFDLRKRLNNIE